MLRAFLVTLLLLSIGCRSTQPPEASGVELTTDRSQYAPGDQVQLQLVNGSDQVLGYNLCFSDLERQDNQKWEAVPDPETVCTTIQHGLEPGDTASFSKTIMSGVPAGTYRYTTSVEYRQDGRRMEVSTEPFRID